ncbi:acetyltransferase, GNAT family [Gottschalkia purinilytica]|uniref:Acetyltransferase, GNAT family n=1 Tax=Gottschalkia purinilytica TaxID=1503 RepID=A0A0L0WDI3_GOTPU|nr:GNAT family N-acetyltransferase [Gottschalkia purinilytica]KNF09496.1 acetyltransferase, GNAT family [Gottschalkia purinilytica]
MIKKIDVNNEDLLIKVLDIQKEAYKKEAEIINFYDIPPLKENIDDIKNSNETLYGYFEENKLLGIISYYIDEKTLDICKIAIHPSYFRRGIANKLLKFIENVDSKVTKIVVTTGSKNEPATRLYETNGFISIGKREVHDGVYITIFEKSINSQTL